MIGLWFAALSRSIVLILIGCSFMVAGSRTVAAQLSAVHDAQHLNDAPAVKQRYDRLRSRRDENRWRDLKARKPPSSLDQMIGQMLLIGFDGISARDSDPRNIARQLRNGYLGGVIFMERNIRSPKQVRELTKLFGGTGAPLPPFISVDQEGGRVQRLASEKGFSQTPDATTLARTFDPSDAYRIYYKLAREMDETGFNLNFGPVLDLDLNPDNPIIAGRSRSFGDRPEQVIAYAQAFISAHRDAGLLTAGKHFPGHGSSWADSHRRLVDLTASWNEMELDPYRVLAGRGMLDIVMVGHLFHPAFSPNGRTPATYSKTAISKILRRHVGFKGVVITDDLAMEAAAEGYAMRDRLIRAIQAGNDILLITKGAALKADFAKWAISVIREEVESGRISKKRISESYHRILALKREMLSRQRVMQARTSVHSNTEASNNPLGAGQ